MMVTIAWAMIVCSMQTGGSVALHSLNFRYSVVCYNVLKLNLYWLLQACDNLSYKVTTMIQMYTRNERKHILTTGRNNLHKNFLCSIKKCCILCSKTTITMISNFILMLMIGDKF